VSANAYPPDGIDPKLRPGLALARKNKKIIAKRTHWPDGALTACLRLEDEHPGWSVDWFHENTCKGFERPAGFRALHGGRHKVELFAATAEEMEPLMVEVPEHEYGPEACQWCLDRLDEEARRMRWR
jgi:hypothetical protein